LYSYESFSVPTGVRLEDANKIVPKKEIFYFENNTTQTRDIAPFADYFRLKLLYQAGGWYCDVDTVCLSSEFPVGPRVWASQCPELKEKDSVNNDLLFFERKDPLLQIMLERCRDIMPRLKRRETLGPILLTSVLQEMGLPKDMLARPETFHPIRWVEAFKLWLPEFVDEIEDRIKFATFLALYQSFPLYVGFDPYKRPPRGSYLSKLLHKFVPELTGVEHEADDVRRLTSRWLRSNIWAMEWLDSINGSPDWRKMLQR
jgi:hypothetical protein